MHINENEAYTIDGLTLAKYSRNFQATANNARVDKRDLENLFNLMLSDFITNYISSDVALSSITKSLVSVAYRQGHIDGWKELEVEKGLSTFLADHNELLAL